MMEECEQNPIGEDDELEVLTVGKEKKIPVDVIEIPEGADDEVYTRETTSENVEFDPNVSTYSDINGFQKLYIFAHSRKNEHACKRSASVPGFTLSPKIEKYVRTFLG